MRIAVEVGWSHKAGGARRMAFNLLREMSRLRPGHDLWLLANTPQPQLRAPNMQQLVLSCPRGIAQVLWDQFLFPQVAVPTALRRLAPRITLYTNNLMPRLGGTPAVLVIHDLTPFILPDAFHPAHGAYQRAYFRYGVRRAARIVTDSEHSRSDLCRLLKVDPGRVEVIPLAADLPTHVQVGGFDSIADRLDPTRGFILYVGAIHPRKNIRRLIEAFILLHRTDPQAPDLAIAGERRWDDRALIPADCPERIRSRIRFLGRVSDEQLSALYRHCRMFVYPSLYEGFGLPVLEAMSSGAPVITSASSSLAEVAADAALLVDPYQVPDLAAAMGRLLADPQLAADLRIRGQERAAQYSWGRTAEAMLAVLEEAAK